MAGQTESERARLVHVGVSSPDNHEKLMAEPPADAHEGMTRMLFVDAVVGVGLPCEEVAEVAAKDGLVQWRLTELNGEYSTGYVWSRPALEALPLAELQELYMLLKTYEVANAG